MATRIVSSLAGGALALAAALALSCAKLNDPVETRSPAPDFAPLADTTIAEGDSLAIDFSLEDPFQLGTVIRLEGPGDLDGNTWRWTPGYTEAGLYTVRLIAHIEGHPEWADTVLFNVTVVDAPNPGPTLLALNDTTILENQWLALRLAALDPEETGLRYTMPEGPAGATLVGDSFSWRPSYTQAGAHEALFVVTDHGQPARSDSLRLRITVLDVDRPPAFMPLRDTVIDTAQRLSVALVATDPDGDAILIRGEALPQGATLTSTAMTGAAPATTALLSWRPTLAQVGAHTLRFVATSRALSDTVTMRVTVILSPPPGPAPIAYWSFDEGLGSMLNDAGPGDRDALLFGSPTWVAGVSGKALRFRGSDWAESQASFPDMTEQTLSAWVYPDTLTTMTLVHETDPVTGAGSELILDAPNTRFLYRTRDPGNNSLHYATLDALPRRRWYYFAAVSKGDSVRLYVNGRLESTRARAGGFALSGPHGKIEIGRKNGANPVRGILDEIKLFDQALTGTQILDEWNRHREAAGY